MRDSYHSPGRAVVTVSDRTGDGLKWPCRFQYIVASLMICFLMSRRAKGSVAHIFGCFEYHLVSRRAPSRLQTPGRQRM